MKNFDFGNLKYNYVAVHCNSQNELDNFIKQCEENDIIVGPDRQFDKNYGYIIVDSERLYCDYVAALKNEDYDIIEWEIENKIDYDREYNIYEIFEFDEGIEFKHNNYMYRIMEGLLEVKYYNTNKEWIQCNCIDKCIINAKFKLVKKDKKVSFEEAIQAYLKGKDIKCIYNDETTIYNNGFIDSDDDKLTMGQILNGEWHIRED
ncbi:hypothetical protein [Clostridium botulinum]|uniref:hypothetical protein n=1 Tax=Clostridium botulinum TaxID=1491 RepID=UPI000A175CD1|nr:hypothetical protein [Clostridium botulinum]AUN11455.1 hypothetical protein RSJ6_13485 [Clostridium botulinum]OSA67687.1 hypothetical protein B2H87_17510 [Clostridium botulinum]